MPNRENITKWAEALESGQYNQARGVLARVNPDSSVSYCCLGVACEVAMANGVQLQVELTEEDDHETVKSYDDCTGILPEAVTDWLGVDHNNPRLLHGSEQNQASALNDTFTYSFEAIAAAVRQTYLT